MPSFPHSADKAPPIPGPGEVLTLEDVKAADFSGVTPLGVLGFPIKHSVSPQMHNAALAVLAKSDPRFSNWRYYRIEVPPERLKEALDLLQEKGFVGLNLTIPHKVEVLKYIETDSGGIAHEIGAINTLTRVGQWKGDNTDKDGFMWALSQVLNSKVDGRDVVLLGAGGVARTIACHCLHGMAAPCRNLWIGNRTPERLSEFVLMINAVASRNDFRGSVHSFLLSEAGRAGLPQSAVVINATSLGLKPDDPSPIDLSMFEKGTIVFDTTYGKGFKSQFLQQAELHQFPSCDGVAMLFYQGDEALYLWVKAAGGTMTKEAADAMSAAAYSALGIPEPRKTM